MMTRSELIAQIRLKKSCLCVGLDTDIEKIPSHLLAEENPILAFNKAIIDATKDYAVSYKINTAFYEAMGVAGWQTMMDTLAYIPSTCFTIADAKRGDIGNTADQYAKAFFQTMNFDAVTIAPYMGKDSVAPFLQYQGKWGIVLGLTSNQGSQDFQKLKVGDQYLYEQVLDTVTTYGNTDNTMFVIGATRVADIEQVRQHIPNHFLLIPGVGAQGGDLHEVMKTAMIDDVGILINVSRGIIYKDNTTAFATAAAQEAAYYQSEMSQYL